MIKPNGLADGPNPSLDACRNSGKVWYFFGLNNITHLYILTIYDLMV